MWKEMNFQAIKWHRRNLRHIHMEEVNPKGLYFRWFKLFENMEMQNYISRKKISDFQALERPGEGCETILHDILTVDVIYLLKLQNFTE